MQALVQAALNEIWSTPDTTNQIIFQLPRITPDGGVKVSYQVMFDTYVLPDTTSTWHLYQIGQVHPGLINLFNITGSWELLSDACNAIAMVANLYTAMGIELPRTRSYYFVTQDKNILVAVQKNLRLPYDFDNDALFLRTYRNAYFQIPEFVGVATLHVGGGLVNSVGDIMNFANQIAAVIAAPGYTGGLYCFVNGRKVGTISTATCVVGDVAEWVYDSSIYKVVDFQIKNLKSFNSTLDGVMKYLLHYPTGWDGKIDYQDNIDMYIVDATTQKGVYVNKNDAKTLRMVTFKDYAVVASYLTAYYPNFLDANGNLTVSNLYLRLHIRYDGIDQAPTEDANRLHYLLQLSDSNQVDAMVGQNANVAAWNAANLEKSAYTTLMRTRYENVTLPMAEQAYGYSVANFKLAKNTQATFVNGGTTWATVPLAFQSGATAYEYDQNGLLIDFYVVSPTVFTYPCTNSNAKYVEFISGTGGNTLDEALGEVQTALTPGFNYRMYMRVVTNGQLAPSYTDVTGSQTAYSVTNGTLKWQTQGNKYRIVRSDKRHLAYKVTLNPSDGVLQHTLAYSSGGSSVGLSVPLGELDVWLNGHALVPGIDYFYAFPTIVVVSKTYLTSTPGPQVLTVRFTGHCKTDFSQQKIEEVGFIWNGLMSVDEPYAIHFEKSERVVVGGRLFSNEEAQYVEDLSSGSFTNGKPYAVREMLNPLNGLIDLDPYTYYATDVATDTAVSQYLALKIGDQVTSPLNPIVDKYVLYSPFLCKILYALLGGNITNSQLSGAYPDALVRTLCQPYEYLLASDPIGVGNTPDMRYCVIEPHWLATSMVLSQTNFRFFANVVRIYANNLVVISELVSVAT